MQQSGAAGAAQPLSSAVQQVGGVLPDGCQFDVLTAVALCGSLLEMMLESSLSDLREAQGVVLPFCPSLVRLLRLLQDFLFAEGTDNHALWSEKVRHGTSRHAGRPRGVWRGTEEE